MIPALLADLNAAAERIWEAASPTCPQLGIEVRPQLGSTNTELMAQGRRGDTAPALLAACHQTAGRGRQGRSWLASPGSGLTFSLGLPLRLDGIPGGGSALSLAVGLAVAQALDGGLARLTPPARTPVGLKWPNDLWLQGRKLGGILIEATPAPGLGDDRRWVVIGVGLNVRDEGLPEGAAALATASGASTGPGAAVAPGGPPAPSLGEVWSWIAPALIRTVQAFETAGFAPLKDAYAQRDVLAGQQVGLWTTPGQGPLSGETPDARGTAIGVTDGGALLVHTPEGNVQSWTSGEVSVRLQST